MPFAAKPLPCVAFFGLSASLVVTVGNNPHSIPSVRSADGGSGYTVPFRIIPDRSEPAEADVQSSRSKGSDVFGDEVARARFLDDPEHFKPESGPLTVEPGTFAGDADILARETAAHDVNARNTDGSKSVGADLSDVIENRNVGPVATENPPGVIVSFTECNGSETAGSLKPKAESSDAGKQVKNR